MNTNTEAHWTLEIVEKKKFYRGFHEVQVDYIVKRNGQIKARLADLNGVTRFLRLNKVDPRDFKRVA